MREEQREVMAIDRLDRTMVMADPRRASVPTVEADGRSASGLVCAMVGHDWMANGIWPFRDHGRWHGTSPDWQRCMRCNRWEILP
jgi:hypothetical protein